MGSALFYLKAKRDGEAAEGLPTYRTTPSSGELAVAYSFLGMRPAKKASRPARTACFIAFAISTASCALQCPCS